MDDDFVHYMNIRHLGFFGSSVIEKHIRTTNYDFYGSDFIWYLKSSSEMSLYNMWNLKYIGINAFGFFLLVRCNAEPVVFNNGPEKPW